MYSLIKYNSNYSETASTLSSYSKDETTNSFKSFKNKAKLLRNTEADEDNGIFYNIAIYESLKYLTNFWRWLEMPLINFKVELKLKW